MISYFLYFCWCLLNSRSASYVISVWLVSIICYSPNYLLYMDSISCTGMICQEKSTGSFVLILCLGVLMIII